MIEIARLARFLHDQRAYNYAGFTVPSQDDGAGNGGANEIGEPHADTVSMRYLDFERIKQPDVAELAVA